MPLPLIPMAIAAAGAYGLSKLRKKPELQQLDPEIKPYSSQTQFDVGSALNKRILGQLGGEGIGYPQGFLEKTTSPFVEQRRADFPQEQADIESQFAGRGLGRSTLAGEAVGDAIQQKNRDINQIMAEAQLRGLTQQKSDEARAEQLASGFSGRELGARSGAAQFGLGVDTANIGLKSDYNKALQQQRDLEIGLPLQAAGSVIGGPVGSAFSSMGGNLTGQQQGFSLSDLIAEQNMRKGPFTSRGSGTTHSGNIARAAGDRTLLRG